ncbi:GNAT family N-acetyltransferase [Intrasporangium calvum]|uniref:GCN5-related N-acetyltransferase n=1 Tax=Intrasporangium calvum (strain ATCC 23552 / DSM 43043 / JCM 3097 / NBRC 12989 / NCIMB 10167 / NRRL B-3866 / 7 KIP) TaxID=710696 RepID=E6S9F0_INTC7|nr:GNAT family N-acetyltransferase [Intrasporangium calvum]ADU48146.1 GCN5-related N-acetyltransferase [Intrasporangium calvum DSM 43043]AXG13214.1 GNAT family acetyltransferase [Intrasporangium calvum]
MIELVRPTSLLADQWWELVDEFGTAAIHGSAYRPDDRADLERPGGLEAWVDLLASYEVDGSDLPEGWVPASYRWVIDDERLVGTITVRHRLTAALLVVGGHIGYAVRPSARRRGVATAALRQALGIAARFGVDPALVTCEDDNLASARTILAAGGVLEDVRGTSRRYWVPTAPRAGFHP